KLQTGTQSKPDRVGYKNARPTGSRRYGRLGNLRYGVCRARVHLQIVTGSKRSPALPWVCANLSGSTPALFLVVRCRFARGVGFSNLRWRLPLKPPERPPATRTGRLV